MRENFHCVFPLQQHKNWDSLEQPCGNLDLRVYMNIFWLELEPNKHLLLRGFSDWALAHIYK